MRNMLPSDASILACTSGPAVLMANVANALLFWLSWNTKFSYLLSFSGPFVLVVDSKVFIIFAIYWKFVCFFTARTSLQMEML